MTQEGSTKVGAPHAQRRPPFPRAWWIEPGRVLGGCYPGDVVPAAARRKLAALLDAGVRLFVCLQPREELGAGGQPFAPYRPLLDCLAAERGVEIVWRRFPVPDMGVPSRRRMRRILDAIDGAEGLTYVHCWGGHGRTGTVAGCLLRRGGLGAEETLERLRAARLHDPHLAGYPCPQTPEQIEMVWGWGERPPSRARREAVMLGQAIGDALGTTLEFTRPDPKPWAPLLAGPHAEITGGGPFRVVRGQVTDDTQMACLLATSLRERGGFDAADVAARYERWSRLAFDIGGQTSGSLREVGQGVAPDQAGLKVWRAGGRRAAGNGSLMRTSPIGALVRNPVARRVASLRDSAITHADPRCMLACAAFNAAIGAGLAGADAEAMTAAADVELVDAATVLRSWWPEEARYIDEGVWELSCDLALARRADPDLYGAVDLVGTQGFVRVAFRLAFWELLHAPSFSSGLVDAVNRGGDADTNGAIVGALLAARYGRPGLPAGWVETVLAAAPPRPWHPTGEYHPVLLPAKGNRLRVKERRPAREMSAGAQDPEAVQLAVAAHRYGQFIRDEVAAGAKVLTPAAAALFDGEDEE